MAAWWACLHGVLGWSAWLIGWPAYVKFALLGLIAAHGLARRPRAAPIVIGARRGPWALPELRLYNLELSSRTRYTGKWALLSLDSPLGPRTTVLLLADQLPRRDWRRLQIALRERDLPVHDA